MQLTRERLRALPKPELHVHLDGSLRPETMLDLASKSGVSLPSQNPEGLAAAMRASDSTDLVGYLEKFSVTLSVLQTPEALARAAYELSEDSAAENIRYLEVRFSPALHLEGGMTLTEAVEAPIRGLSLAREKFGLRSGLIICAVRTLEPDASLELARLAVEHEDRGVVAFDLAGAEAGNPARDHREAFQLAEDANLPITVHAGEAAGAWSISDALHRCHAWRIGHGTRLGEDPELLAFVNARRIPLEVCLTSNIQTGAAASFREHPVRRFFDQGLVVTLNTDNRLMSGTTLSDEYRLASEHLGFSWEELKEISLLGFQAAFLPYAEKLELLQEVEEEMAALG